MLKNHHKIINPRQKCTNCFSKYCRSLFDRLKILISCDRNVRMSASLCAVRVSVDSSKWTPFGMTLKTY